MTLKEQINKKIEVNFMKIQIKLGLEVLPVFTNQVLSLLESDSFLIADFSVAGLGWYTE